MQFKIIKGLSNKDPVFIEGINQIKLFILNDTINNKIVDISCFYKITDDDLINFVNRLGGF